MLYLLVSLTAEWIALQLRGYSKCFTTPSITLNNERKTVSLNGAGGCTKVMKDEHRNC
jgi:hypothetical protein